VKNFPGMFRTNPAKAAKVFEALNGQVVTAQHALRLLSRETAKWKFSNEGIQFRDIDFARQFDGVERQIREDAQQMNEALRAWREAIGP
jgi:hypothetical protein